MKKLLLLVAIILAPITLLGDKYDIPINKSDTNNTRAFIDAPKASIDNQTYILTISFNATGTYSFYIENYLGDIVYTSSISADGFEYNYDLTGIGHGAFHIYFIGHSGEYEGSFML
ncbi:MAG TPA: hypothetical protein IAC05_08155 [Candidatus Coprenecus stercorigallinarum]|nr:hypothetical protein [Candidatus Coprenecus stercorigallinarum]